MRIVVTGIGLVTPLGNDFWECVSEGKGQRPKSLKVQGFGEAPDRFLKIGLESGKKAIVDSKLSYSNLKEAGVTISSSKGGIPFCLPDVSNVRGVASNITNILNMPNVIGEKFGCHGPSLNIISACATGLNSIIIGINIIKTGRAKVVITGAVDACLTDFINAGFSRLGVLAKDGICRPYSKNRSGFVLSEGACAVVIEELKHAQERGAKIYCEITGWANLGDAYSITSLNPSGETVAHAIKICLEKSGTSPEEIDYINTHGTGTKENDFIETIALKRFFGQKINNIPLSSTKGVTGHMLGATGAVEFAICLFAMKENYVPPTANLDEPDPLCDLNYTPNKGRKHKINKFLKLSYGFGGHVACIEGKKWEQDTRRLVLRSSRFACEARRAKSEVG